MKVLIADDDPEILEALGTAFQANGWEVFKCANGQSALENVRINAPDLIMLDVNMPKLNGWEVCKSLKQDEATRRIPVALLTARTKDIDELMGLEVGADLYLKKPLGALEAYEAAKKLVEGK